MERVAALLGLREAALGLVAAVAADGPEITTAVTGLVRGQRNIALGVVLGSNAFNLAALLGLGALFGRRIRLHRDVIVFEGLVAGAVGLVSVAVASGAASPTVALSIAACLVVPYVAISSVSPNALAAWKLPLRFGTRLADAVRDEEAELAAAIHPSKARSFDVAVAVGALALVIGSSVVLERAVSTIGSRDRLPQILIGGVVLAAVTSLPNAVSAIYLARRGRGSAVLSTALNSNNFNVVFGLLVPATLLGLAHPGAGLLVAVWYTAMTMGALALAYRGRGLGRVDGVVVICAYLVLVGLLAGR